MSLRCWRRSHDPQTPAWGWQVGTTPQHTRGAPRLGAAVGVPGFLWGQTPPGFFALSFLATAFLVNILWNNSFLVFGLHTRL